MHQIMAASSASVDACPVALAMASPPEGFAALGWGLVTLCVLACALWGGLAVVSERVSLLPSAGFASTLAGRLWARLTRKSGFEAPTPGVGYAAERIVDLLHPHRFPAGGLGTAWYLRTLVEATEAKGVPYATMWRWGRVYGPQALTAALELDLSVEEWFLPFDPDPATRAAFDVEGLLLVVALRSDRFTSVRAGNA